ncbi:MAG: ATP synthase subunit I [Bryobacteraceae bacterium]
MMAILSVAGSIAAYFYHGRPAAVGYAVGAAISILNFRSFEKIVAMTGAVEGDRPPKRKSAVFLGVRYFVFAGGAYAIIKVFEANFLAALIGFFVCVAAVIIEILYELIYAGT